MSGLEAFLQQIRRAQEADGSTTLEPAVDDRDLGDIGDAGKIREDEDLEQGAVLKATLEPGTGAESPKLGDLVFLHYSISSAPGGDVLFSTRPEHGGAGTPSPFVLGRGKARTLRGVELALAGMRLHERCMLELKPEYAYKHKECTMDPPQGLNRGAKAAVDVQLVRWYPGQSVQGVDAAPGVIKRTLEEGQGWETPRQPFEVTLRVEARTLAADCAQQRGPLCFTTASSGNGGDDAALTCGLGSGALPPGLETAICTMRREEVAVVWCPADAARGGAAVPPAPPAAQYVEYSVQLLDFLQVRDLSGDGSATKRTLRKGRGEFPADCPLEDSTLQLHVRVKPAGARGWLYDSRTASAAAALAEGSANGGSGAPLVAETGSGALPECVDSAVRLMLRGEVASVHSDWAGAYAGRSDAPAGLTPGGAVEFEIELVDFESEPNWAELDAAGKLRRAAKWKEQGNAVFKAGHYRLAKQKYLKGIRSVDQTLDIETEEQASTAAAIKLACLVNLAVCAQREGEPGEAISWCNKALSEDPGHAKAHFRRAVAQYHLGEYEAARDDFEEARGLDPGAAGEVDRELARMAAREKAGAGKQRREMGSFFDKGKK